ncbi:MAG: ABC transporter permease [Acetivibrionales bacterium]|jgi:simple sugar transport system permease protein
MKKNSKELILLGIFVFLFILMSVLSPSRFLSLRNLQSMAFQLPEFGILSLAMMIVIVTGGINLSVVSTSALAGIVAAMTMAHYNSVSGLSGLSATILIIISIAACAVVALASGAFNGFIIAYIGVSPVLATLGTMTLFEGISLNFTKGGAISGLPEQFSWFGNGTIGFIPVPMIIFIIVTIITIILLEHTPWGLSVYMTGCNPVATMFSGINVKMVLMKVYLYSALLGGVAAIVMTSRYNSAKVDYGSSYMLQSVAASVLGGTNIAGGYGKVLGTVTAVAILQIVSSGLNILGINRYIVDIIMGGILIVTLSINFFTSKRKKAGGRSVMLDGLEIDVKD